MRRVGTVLASAAILALAITVLFPTPALASIFNVADDINNWIEGIIIGAINACLNTFFGVVRSMIDGSILSSPFEDLFGSNNHTLYNLAAGVSNTAVKPIAHSVLALVMLVQLVKISEKIDGSATLPAVREILFLAVFFTIFVWLINNSGDLLTAAYDDLLGITRSVTTGAALGDMSITVDKGTADIGTLVIFLICLIPIALVGLITYVVAILMVYARSLQLYVYLMLSPIPFALLGFEGTRHMGINFLKNFVALCLAGAVMVFILTAFPAIWGVVVTDVTGNATLSLSADIVQVLTAPLKMVALCLVLMFGLIKSGSWARDVLGG